MSMQKRRSRSDASDVTDASVDSEVLNDVVLIVEGKKIPANGGILSYNSSVLGTMIANLGDCEAGTGAEFGDIGNTMVSKGTPRGRGPIEVVLPEQSYGSVKTMMRYLQTKYSKDEPLSGETALKLLPLIETYKMTRLRKKCEAAILDELETMQRKKPADSGRSYAALKYLTAADRYGLGKVKSVCIEECSANCDATWRKDIADDQHISDKTKVKILDKMCDNLGTYYNKNLEEMQRESQRRYDEIVEKREKLTEATEAWKKDVREEVEDIIQAKNYRKLYEHLLEQFAETKKYLDNIESELDTFKREVDGTIKPLEDLSLKVKIAQGEAMAKSRQAGQETFGMTMALSFDVSEVINESSLEYLQSIDSSIFTTSDVCRAHLRKIRTDTVAFFTEALKNFDVDLFQNTLTSTFALQDRMDELSVELEDRMKVLGDIETVREKEKLQHEKTKTQLQKQMKKVHKINTWVKWAKPVEEDENRCVCFRHSAHKKVYNN